MIRLSRLWLPAFTALCLAWLSGLGLRLRLLSHFIFVSCFTLIGFGPYQEPPSPLGAGYDVTRLSCSPSLEGRSWIRYDPVLYSHLLERAKVVSCRTT